ncbi:MAG: AbrB/MazE/SpoVT family DNA-binding domain-containing protein [Acidobacteriota bacterium]
MDLKVSSKYQVVIPKAVRKQLNIKPGQKLRIDKVQGKSIVLSVPLSAEEHLAKYAGTLKDTPWQKEGVDAAEWIRRERDNDRW